MPSPPRLPLMVAAAVLAATACGGGTAVDSDSYLSFREQPTACGAEQPPSATRMLFDAPEDMGITGPVRVRLETSCGDIVLTLDPATAPVTVNSFVFLVDQGYYDGTVLHRVVPGFMVQAGDPNAGEGGAPGYRLPDELPPAGYVYPQGALAMANAGPDTAGSQFFITVGEVTLPPDYTVFGEVTAGFDAVAAMTQVPLGVNAAFREQSRPLETIYLERAEVLDG